MDHFNATVKDGKLVRTRRGMQVSRQKFNGLSFVNASPQDTTTRPGPSRRSKAPTPPKQEIRFVEEDTELWSQGPESDRKDAENSDTSQETRRRRRVAHRRKSPSSDRADTPSSRQSSAPLDFGRVFTDQNMLQIDPSLASAAPTSTPSPQALLTAEEWAKFERYYDHIPRGLYPYEDLLTYNPARGHDFYSIITSDPAALHAVLMCGGITEAVINSDPRPGCLAYHISNICAMLNQKLGRSQAADVVTMHCIATLAWMGCYVGRLDHWHMHMSGLRKVLDLKGGFAGLPPWLVAEMYKADLKGATALASSPYLPFTRHYDSVTRVLPRDTHRHTTETLAALLNPLGINPNVVTALSSVSLFAATVRSCRQSPGVVTLDPHAFTEEWQAITHMLLTQPGPLRAAHSDPVASNPFETSNPNTIAAADELTSPTERYMGNHRLLPSRPIVPARYTSPGDPFESALRIAALLYLKELLPDWPRNLGGYGVLLNLLRHHLSEIVRRHGSGDAYADPRRPPPTSHSDRPESAPIDPLLIPARLSHTTVTQETTRSPPQPRHMLNTPPPPSPSPPTHHHPVPTLASTRSLTALTAPTTTSTSTTVPHRHPTSTPSTATASIKPLTTFLALTGYLASQRANAAERRLSEPERYPCAIYRDALRSVAGLRDAADVDAALALPFPATDRGGGEGSVMALVRLFDMGSVFGGGDGAPGSGPVPVAGRVGGDGEEEEGDSRARRQGELRGDGGGEGRRRRSGEGRWDVGAVLREIVL